MLEVEHPSFGTIVEFDCDKCEQHISIYRGSKPERLTQRILPTLWPSNPVSGEIWHRMADDFEYQQKFFAALKELAGVMTKKERQARYLEVEMMAADCKKDHPLTWLQRLKR